MAGQFKRIMKSQGQVLLTYHAEIVGVVMTALCLFFLLALISYNPNDACYFYFDSQSCAITNLCGGVGAQLAAMMIFFFGSISYLVLFVVFSLAAIVWSGYKFAKARLLRIFACIISVPTLCGILAIAKVDLFEKNPGGVIGYLIKCYSEPLLGAFGSFLALLVVLWCCSVIILESSIVDAIYNAYCSLRDVVSRGYKTVSCLGMTVARVSSQPISVLYTSFTSFAAWVGSFKKAAHPQESPARALLFTEEQVGESHAYNWFEMQGERFELIMHCSVGDMIAGEKRAFLFPVNSIFSSNVFLRPNALEQVCVKGEGISEPSFIEPATPTAMSVIFPLPDVSLFEPVLVKKQEREVFAAVCKERARCLEEKLRHFGVKGSVAAICPGPVITLFEYLPDIDTKISKIIALEDDLALALKATSIRIVAPIPGRNVVGFEISNEERASVHLSTIVHDKNFMEDASALPLVFGCDILGKPVIEDLVSMPHLLVAGSTGAGKSVGLNAMLAGLLFRCNPQELRLVLVDPKRLEFAPYQDIPHLLFPIVTEPHKVVTILKWLVHEMEERYQKMSDAGVRNLVDYRKRFNDLPYIVLVVDELADLMLVAGKDVEVLIMRLAQMARAAGIHMILATQRPSVDVITGVIKVNLPSRVAYRVSSKIDSKTILDTSGAEKLLGKGDMLYQNVRLSDLRRVHGAYVSDEEIHTLTNYLRSIAKPAYCDLEEIVALQREDDESGQDDLFDEVFSFVQTQDEISISLLQRKYRIGFNRSARLIAQLEQQGILAPAQGSKPRKVLHR